MTKKKPKKKTAPKHKPSVKRTLEDVLTSLQDLAKNELSDVDLQSRAGLDPEEKHEKSQNEKKGSNQDLPETGDVDSIQVDISPPQTELVSGETGDIFEGLELLPEDQITDKAEADQVEKPENENDDIRWEDIPVLEDVAEDPLDVDNNQLPDPKQARDIAIQVAARLNIEMRAQELAGLDIATINRLRDLLVKELAKAASKSENDDK